MTISSGPVTVTPRCPVPGDSAATASTRLTHDCHGQDRRCAVRSDGTDEPVTHPRPTRSSLRDLRKTIYVSWPIRLIIINWSINGQIVSTVSITAEANPPP